MRRAHGQAGEVPGPPAGRVLFGLILVAGMYLTLAFAALVALSVGGAAMYAVCSICSHGRMPPVTVTVLAGLVGMGGLVGAAAVLRGVCNSLKRPATTMPGILLSQSDEPELHRCIGELCEELGCRLPDSVVLHPKATLSAERGKIAAENGFARGCILTIGCPLLSALTVDELRGVIAHELAHFTGWDAPYTSSVLPAYRNTVKSLEVVSEQTKAARAGGGGATTCAYTLPMRLPLLILKLYVGMFARVHRSMRRVREERADAIAAHLVGRDIFASALWQTMRASGFFERFMLQRMQMLQRTPGTAGLNHFAAFRAALQQAGSETPGPRGRAWTHDESAHADHPPLSTRLKCLPNVPGTRRSGRRARKLLSHPDKHERELSRICEVPGVVLSDEES